MAPASNKTLQHHWSAASCGRSLHYGRDDRTYFVILSEAEGSPAIWHLPRIRPYNIISLLPAVGDPSTTVGMTEVEVRMTGVEVEMAMAMAMAMIE